MKKLVAFLLASLLALALFACGGNNPAPTGNTPTQSPTQPGTAAPNDTPDDALYFAPKDIVMEIGASAAPVLEALRDKLGDPLSERECPSCALKAKDIDYKYDGFVLTVTYPEEGGDYISCIKLSSDVWATPGGITIGSPAEDIFKIYGTDYREDIGHYYFTEGLSILHFAAANGQVKQIQYEYDWDNA